MEQTSDAMARVQLITPDEDRDQFADRDRPNPFESAAHVEEFFLACDDMEGPERESGWEEHLRVIDESRGRSIASS